MANFTILEPMSTGDVIDRAVRIYRRNFAPLLSIVAVPSFIGYLASTTFLFGYSKVVLGSVEAGVPETSPVAIMMMAVGGLLYPVWLFILLLTVCGMSRVIGDHIMLDESITFRKCFAAARKRIGDIFLLGLLSIVILIVVYFILSVIFIIVFLIAAVLIGVTASSEMPPWLVATFTGIAALVAVGLGIAGALWVIARIVFLPQVMMIEGQSAGLSLGRAMNLGKGNWYRVGGIVLFTYFVSLSLLAALTLPVMTGLYMTGILTAEFMVSPTWNILYTSFSQISNLLALPIWIVAYTLLYFDSRVRKEAYDLELLAREVNPGFYWQAPRQTVVMGYPVPYANPQGRVFVQTSPLGLAGWRPPPHPVPPNVATPTPAPAHENRPTAPPLKSAAGQWASPEAAQFCFQCGAKFEPEARFCMRCGTPALL
ncbi:MAG: zinc ribbon domain-containing protein [Acidobacteria bacterium]|nr:zinc ribbon domain-containing protein [Acidobacteriota bacterium]